MIDIHTHVLPGVDDGAQTMDESLALLAQAADSGVDTLVATPHCNIPDEFDNYADSELDSIFDRLDHERELAQIPLRLCRGMEVFATPELPELLENRRVWTLNDTRYFLVEFAFHEDPEFCHDVLKRCRDLGFLPIIAHPERYYFVQDDPSIAYAWCTEGYGLQLNKGSILGRFGERPWVTADILLQHGLAACVASDAHNPMQRSTHMGELREYLNHELGESYAGLLLEENPARILSGRELLGYEPIPFR